MWYTDKIDTKLIETITMPVMTKLVADGFKESFGISVLVELNNAVAKVDEQQARIFWAAMCCGDELLFSPEWVHNYRCTVDECKGTFEMPSWGTYGT